MGDITLTAKINVESAVFPLSDNVPVTFTFTIPISVDEHEYIENVLDEGVNVTYEGNALPSVYLAVYENV